MTLNCVLSTAIFSYGKRTGLKFIKERIQGSLGKNVRFLTSDP
jgi:hypothetical protein